MKVELCLLDESDYDSWDRFVASCESGSVYSCTRYLRILAESTGCNLRVAAHHVDGQFFCGIPLFEKTTRWGRVIAPRIFLPYNGFVLRDDASKYPSQRTSRLVTQTDAIAAFIEEQRYADTLVKCRWSFEDARAFVQRGWRVTPTYTYVVPLSNLPQQWSLVDRNLKRLIRRCDREGFEVTEDDDFESFYRMHSETHDRKGAPIYFPKPVFTELFSELRKARIARLYQARLPDGTSVAAQIVLASNNNATETVSACADSRYLNSGASAYLRWKAFENLAADGYTHNDLTDATLNSVARFKSQFGGDLRLCLAMAYPPTLLYRLGTGLGNSVRSAARSFIPMLDSQRT